MQLSRFKLPLIAVGVLVLYILFFLDLFESDKVTVKSGTPLFEKPLGKVITVLNKEREFKVVSKELVTREKFPLMKCLYFYQIKLNDKNTVFVAPELKVNMTENKKNGRRQATIVKRFQINWRLIFASSICVIAVFYFIYFHFIKKNYNLSLSISVFVIFLFFLRWVILASNQNYPVSIFCSATDESYYFQTAKDIIRLNFSTPWEVSIGLPLYYVPYCLFFGVDNIYNILIPMSYFNGFIIMPLITVLLFFVSKKITGSYKKSIIFALIFSIMPVFYHSFEAWDIFLFKSRFSLPDVDGYRFYKQYLSLGFNTLPDIPSALIIISMIFYALFGKESSLYVFVISFLFAFSCLIRLNNIFMAPLVAMLFWFKFKEEYFDLKVLLSHFAIAVFTFWAVFSMQLVINYHHFGSIFKTAYNDVNEEGKPIAISAVYYMKNSIKAMIGNNYLVMVMGVCGLIFQKDRKKQIILSLWTIPMILFFSTTHVIVLSSYRYLIAVFPGLFIAFFALPVWEEIGFKKMSVVVIALTFTFLAVAPAGMFPFSGALPFDIQVDSYGKTLAICLYVVALLIDVLTLIVLRNNRKICFFLAFLFVLFFVGNAFLIMAMFVFVILKAFVNIYKELLPLVKYYYCKYFLKRDIELLGQK
jgi:hypothetical protein